MYIKPKDMSREQSDREHEIAETPALTGSSLSK
jgi:hypothetical protein